MESSRAPAMLLVVQQNRSSEAVPFALRPYFSLRGGTGQMSLAVLVVSCCHLHYTWFVCVNEASDCV